MQKMILLEQQLKAIAYLKRLEILKFLQKSKTADVNTIARSINLSVHATSKHLIQLKNVQILTRSRRSRRVFYRLNLKQGALMKALLQILK